MLTFIISVLLVSFICKCFFKKTFWENRYLVLLISGSVALVATLTINFSARKHLQTRTEISWTEPLATFYVPTNLPFDTTSKILFVKNYDYYAEHKAKEFYRDTTKKQIPVVVLFYTESKKSTNICIGTMKGNYNQDYWHVNNVYIVKTTADSIAYVTKKTLYYDTKSNNWITGFSLPRKSAIVIMHLPPKVFATIPDSLIRPIPF